MKNIIYLIFGIFFGIILTKSEVISWFRIHNMFMFREAHMYLVIGSAVVVGAVSVAILKLLKIKSASGEPISFKGKAYNKGFIIGGIIFGIGWAITGACPGPIFGQIGAGAYPAIFTLAGAIVGALLYQHNRARLPH
ncbi:transporter [candidate division KSB1 bacterium]|nr:YeeE/YedE family protein [candidate division KSB1 bacterium]RQW02085.1 MAG: transporter [candidate division KSB1 bacterium]